MNCYIYARVSSIGDRQSTERQVKNLTDYADSNQYKVKGIYEEHISGAKSNKERKVLTECLTSAKENKIDCILFSEMSRCGRAIWEVLETIKFCADSGINLYFQKEGLTLLRDGKVDSIMAIYISCLGFCAEKERENIYFRLSQGREMAKQKGVKMGRKKGSTKSRDQKEQEYAKVIKLLRKGESMRNVAKLCDVSLSSVLRVKKEFDL
ncbi:MAG: recombinase family protein [Bacteroidales bacterium]|nr:recombinase family protein [Bacteroidales bacterium]